MNGPSKVCALVTTKCKVYTDPIGVKNGLWPLRCPQRKFCISYSHISSSWVKIRLHTENQFPRLPGSSFGGGWGGFLPIIKSISTHVEVELGSDNSGFIDSHKTNYIY